MRAQSVIFVASFSYGILFWALLAVLRQVFSQQELTERSTDDDWSKIHCLGILLHFEAYELDKYSLRSSTFKSFENWSFHLVILTLNYSQYEI